MWGRLNKIHPDKKTISEDKYGLLLQKIQRMQNKNFIFFKGQIFDVFEEQFLRYILIREMSKIRSGNIK